MRFRCSILKKRYTNLEEWLLEIGCPSNAINHIKSNNINSLYKLYQDTLDEHLINIIYRINKRQFKIILLNYVYKISDKILTELLSHKENDLQPLKDYHNNLYNIYNKLCEFVEKNNDNNKIFNDILFNYSCWVRQSILPFYGSSSDNNTILIFKIHNSLYEVLIDYDDYSYGILKVFDCLDGFASEKLKYYPFDHHQIKYVISWKTFKYLVEQYISEQRRKEILMFL